MITYITWCQELNIVSKRQTHSRQSQPKKLGDKKRQSHIGRLASEIKMATNQELSIEIIAQIAMVVATAAVQAISVERRDEDEITRCRGDTRGMRPR